MMLMVLLANPLEVHMAELAGFVLSVRVLVLLSKCPIGLLLIGDLVIILVVTALIRII